MNRIPKTFSLRHAAAGLAVVALFSVAACSTDEATTDPSSVATTAAQSTGAQTTAAPETTAETTTSAPATNDQDYTDESLAAVLAKVTVDGKAATPLPIATVRGQASTNMTVEPAACTFAAEGLLPYVKKNPAALAAPALTSGMSLVSLSAADADKLIADRNALLGNPDCANITLTASGQTMKTKITGKDTEGFGFDDAKIMVSNAGAGDVYGFTARKGNLLVSVNSPDLAQVKEIATQIAANL